MTLNPEDFFNKMRPYAEKVKAALGIPVSVTLAQWAVESGFEKTERPKWIGGNNYSGITFYKDGSFRGFKKYDSIDQFIEDHIRQLSSKDEWKGYTKIVQASKAGKPPSEIAVLFSKSRWDAGNYLDNTGRNKILDKINQFNLTRFDSGGGQASQSISFTHPDGQTTQYAIDHGNKPSTNNDGDNKMSITEFLSKLSYIFTGEFWEKTGLVIVGIVLFVIGFKFVLTSK